MASEEEFLERLKAAFREEGAELLLAINLALADIESIETDGQRKRLHEILTSLHTLKGSSRAVNLPKLASLTQSLEALIIELKSLEGGELAQALQENKKALVEIVDGLSNLIETEYDALEGALEIKLSSLLARTKQNKKSIEQSEQEITGTFNLHELSSMIAKSVEQPGAASSETDEKDAKAEKLDKLDKTERIERIERIEKDPTVKIKAERLDELLTASEELLTVKSQLSKRQEELEALKHAIGDLAKRRDDKELTGLEKRASRLLRQSARDNSIATSVIEQFFESARALTLQPLSVTLEIFPRLVRDLSRDLQKECELTTYGAHLEVDRQILEKLKEPLLHLIRNAIDHGLEDPGERESLGKQRKASIVIAAQQLSADNLEITISDDGRGIDGEKLKRKALEKNLISEEESRSMTYSQSIGLIFNASLSTRDVVSEISGRGIGMNIVKERIEETGGRLDLTSTAGSGTTFRITLPTRVATFAGVQVQANDQTFILPVQNLIRAMRVHPLALEAVDGKKSFYVDGQQIPIAHLSDALEIAEDVRKTQEKSAKFKYLELLVLNFRGKTGGVIVDHVLDQGEFLVKKCAFPVDALTQYAGVTLLADGTPSLVLDVRVLIDRLEKAVSTTPDSSVLAGLLSTFEDLDEEIAETGPAVQHTKNCILLVDDSITSRVLLKNIMESAGYTVHTAVNGEEGLSLLRRNKYAAVLTDAEMPVMNGLEMTRRIKGDPDLRGTPVIMITSLSSDQDKASGIDSGAEAYYVKGGLDSINLIHTVKRLTGA